MKPPIVEVMEHYGITVFGNKVCCPFHGDTNPSMSINRSESLYHCFSCGAAGDSWTLIMEREGCGFEQAVKWAQANLSNPGRRPGEGSGEVRGGLNVQRRGLGGSGLLGGARDRLSDSGRRPSWRSR